MDMDCAPPAPPPGRSESEEDIIMGLSVAEKRSLFMQMERERAGLQRQFSEVSPAAGARTRSHMVWGAGAGRSGNGCGTASKRFVTQPVTTEEVKAAQWLAVTEAGTTGTGHDETKLAPAPAQDSGTNGPSSMSIVTPVTNGKGRDRGLEPKTRNSQAPDHSFTRSRTRITDKVKVKMLIKVEEDGSGEPAPAPAPAPMSMPSLKDRVRLFNGLARASSMNGYDQAIGSTDAETGRYKFQCRRPVVSKRFSTTPVPVAAKAKFLDKVHELSGNGTPERACERDADAEGDAGANTKPVSASALATATEGAQSQAQQAGCTKEAAQVSQSQFQDADADAIRLRLRLQAARVRVHENKLLRRQGQEADRTSTSTQVEQDSIAIAKHSSVGGAQIINTCTTDTVDADSDTEASAATAAAADLPKPKQKPAFEVQGQRREQQQQQPEPDSDSKTQNLETEDSSFSSSEMGLHSLKEDGSKRAHERQRDEHSEIRDSPLQIVSSVKERAALISANRNSNADSSMGNSNSNSSCLGGQKGRRASDFSVQSGKCGGETNNNKIVSFVKKQLLSRSSSCNFPKMELEIPYDDPPAPQTAPIDSPGSGGSGRSNRIKEKIAALKTNGELSWMKRVPGKKVAVPVPCPVIGMDAAAADGDRHSHSPSSSPEQDENENAEPKNNKESSSVIAARLSLLEKSQDGWKKRISESDATAFTVQGRLEKAGKLAKSFSSSQCQNNNAKNLNVNLSPAHGGGDGDGGQKKLSPSKLMFSKSQHELSACLMKHQQEKENKTKAIKDKDANANLGGGDGDTLDGGKASALIKKSPTVGVVPLRSTTRARMETSSSSESNPEDDVVLRSIAQNDNETFTHFFASAKATSSTKAGPKIDDASFSSLISAPASHKLLGVRRNVKVNRKHAASRNPVKVLAERTTAIEQAYFEVAPEVREKELKKRVQMESLAKSSPLSVEALAGLASKEDFSAVKLKAAAISTQQFPHPMLLQIKGKRYVQTRLVPPTTASINSGDCFVLVTDGGDTVYQYIGEFSNRMERSKLADVVVHITQRRDLGCGPNSRVHTLEEPFSPSRYESFIKALGGGVIKSEEDELGDEHDEAYELGVIKTNRVYEVDPDKEELVPCGGREGAWGSQPRHAMLKEHAVLVFDFGSEMYVWSGSKADLHMKKLGSRLARKLYDGYKKDRGSGDEFSPLSEIKRPSWCWFKRVVQFMEPILFREKFFDWPDEGRFSKNVKSNSSKKEGVEAGFNFQPCDPKEMEEAWRELEDAGLELQGFNVGRGDTVRDKERRTYVISTENLVAWHISEFSTGKVPMLEMAHFYSSETYVIRWSYIVTTTGRDLKGNISKQAGVRGRERTAYFFWHGLGSSITEKGTSALMTVELDEEKGPQIRVAQGTEPPAFLNLFQGLMFIHDGSPDACARRERRLYVAMGGQEQEGHFLEVAPEPASFRSRGSFMYLTKKSIYVWYGQGSCSASRKIAAAGAKYLSAEQGVLSQYAGLPIIEVEELKEPKSFLDSLQVSSSNVSKWRESYASTGWQESDLQLFRFNTLSGSFEAVPVPSVRRKATLFDPFPVQQEELYGTQQPSLFLINTPDKTWLWQGWVQAEDEENSNSTTGSLSYRWAAERKAALETAIAFSAHSGHSMEGSLVHSGLEPPKFRSLFPCWRVNEEAAAYNAGKSPCVSLADALRPFKKSSYTLEELQARPEGVDVLKLEAYLSDEDFEKLLKMSREEFGKLASWKKTELKKQAGLF